MMITARYTRNAHYEESVANALVTAPNVVAALTKEAKGIAALAKANVNQAPKMLPSDAKNVAEVAASIKVLPAKGFVREQKLRGTKTDIVLVVADAWQSKWYEFGKGRGNHFPALRFMRLAAAAAASKSTLFKGRGRSRGGAR